MNYRIVIDAGHGGSDLGASYKGRLEKDDNLRLALAVGQILKDSGQDVIFTRTDDIYQTPFEKAQIANNADADFFISFHRNSSEFPNQYSGAQTLVYNDSGIQGEMARNINSALGEIGFADLGVIERPGLVVLRRTKMPALLIETGFINTDKDNQLFDDNFDAIAHGIADAVLGTLHQTEHAAPPTQGSILYRVQVGQFRSKSNADNMLYELLDKGYPAFLLFEDGLYKVQVGAFRQLENAVKMEQNLRQNGYSTWITT